jgi:hypothetical protein
VGKAFGIQRLFGKAFVPEARMLDHYTTGLDSGLEI